MPIAAESNTELVQRKKFSGFVKAFSIYALVLLVLFFVSQVIVWTFLSSYQKGQSDVCASSYVSSLSEDEWKALLAEKISGSDFQEKKMSVDKAYELYIKDCDFSCRRSPTESKGDNNVFKVSKDGVVICTMNVIKDGNGAYNMPRWSVTGFNITDDFVKIVNPETTVYIPSGAELFINGSAVNMQKFVACVSPFATEFEKDLDKNFLSLTFRAPCGDYDVSATLNECTLTKSDINDDSIAFDNNDKKLSVTVDVPGGSEVYVNGIRVNTRYIADKNLKYSFLNKLEEMKENAPTSTVYKIEGLYESPEVKVLFNGEELVPAEESNSDMYRYPFNSGFNNYTLTVPEGAKVAVNGIDITDAEEYIFESDVEYSEVSAYKNELRNPLVCRVYSLIGLFFEPEIVVTDKDGNKCAVIADDKYSFRCDIAPNLSDVEAYKEMAEGFGERMMEYMFYGRSYLNTGFNNVLAHTRKGSNAYTTLYSSYAGMYWRASHTIEYNKLYADNFISYADNAFRCDVHYDVTGSRVTDPKRKENASGIYRILYVNNGVRWEIVELYLLNDSE